MLCKHIHIKWDKISSDGINHKFKSLDSHIIWMDVKTYSKKLCVVTKKVAKGTTLILKMLEKNLNQSIP